VGCSCGLAYKAPKFASPAVKTQGTQTVSKVSTQSSEIAAPQSVQQPAPTSTRRRGYRPNKVQGG